MVEFVYVDVVSTPRVHAFQVEQSTSGAFAKWKGKMRGMTHRVFVYGTLKSGFWNHYLLEGCEFFGGAATVPSYRMIESGFPVIMPDAQGRPIAGEVYSVDDETLARLDQLEREGSSYDRKLIDVTLPLASGEGLSTKAFIYVGREDRFGKAFARGPLYETVNERGELDWKAGTDEKGI